MGNKGTGHFYSWEQGNRGGARNFPTEGLELPTGGAKKTEKWCFRGYFAKFAPTRTKISSDGGLGASDGGGV